MLIEKLTALEAGSIDRMAVSKPPRHGGTLTTSHLFVCWYLGRHPDRSVALCSYNEDIAGDLGRAIMRTMKSPVYKAIFPDAALSADIGSASHLELQRGGHMYSVSRAGAFTGRGCDVLICDDLLKDQQEAASPTIRRSIHDWYERVGLTRLTPMGAVVLISTRWHEDDLTGHVLAQENEKPWEILNFTAIAGENDLLGRQSGEALWPARFDLRYLARRRAEMGSRGFVSLYLGAPSEAQGNIFRRDQWRTYKELPPLKRIIASADTAFKVTSTADFSAIQIWAEAANGFYLLTAFRDRLAYPDLKRTLISFCEQWRPEVVLIEDAASGQSLIQELRDTTSLPLKPIRPDRDKISRAESCTPLLESGRVFIPESAPWLNDFLDELSGFPNSGHDDQTDAATQALNYLRGQSGVYGLLSLLSDKWDGFVSTFQTAGKPDKINPEKTAAFELEKQIRGLVSAQPETFKPEVAPGCPACSSTLTLRISQTQCHCNQCGFEFFPNGVPLITRGQRGEWLARH
jgi:predicted phage terminase large subunit-like protein